MVNRELTSLEKVLQIIREVGAEDGSPEKSSEKKKRGVETDIDIFSDENIEEKS